MAGGTGTRSSAGTSRCVAHAPIFGHGGDSRCDHVLADAGPNRADDAYQVVTRDEREGRLSGVSATSHRLLGEGHATGFDLDEGLSRGRRGQRAEARPRLKT